jgi:hypothetical protein
MREREIWQSLRCVWFERKNEEWKKIMQSNEKTWTNINLKVSSHSKYEFKSEIKKYTLSMLFYTISLYWQSSINLNKSCYTIFYW